MEVPEGKTVALLGANGSGNSTILKTVSGIKKPTTDEIRFQEARIDGEQPENIVRWGIGSIMGGWRLFPCMTVIENLKMGAFARSDKVYILQDDRMRFEGSPDDFSGNYVGESHWDDERSSRSSICHAASVR